MKSPSLDDIPEDRPAVTVELGGCVEDVELVHGTVQADAPQLQLHRELEEPADGTH